MTDLADIIARLEKSTGPDRMLDHAIELERTRDNLNYGTFPAPSYTSSLDSALKLVPEGRDWDVAGRTVRGQIVLCDHPEAFDSVGRKPGDCECLDSARAVLALIRAPAERAWRGQS